MDYNLNFNFDGADTMYLTHSLHPYPAKFPPQLPHSILEEFGKPGDVVFDPFCGSGTTLVEARLLGYDAIGVDVNGLSTLLSKVKATPLTDDEIKQAKSFIAAITDDELSWQFNRPSIVVKEIEGRDHWFQYNVAEEITFILQRIDDIESKNVQDFFKIVLSSIIVRVSNQESDTRFAAKNKDIPDNFTLALFIKRSGEYLKRIVKFSKEVVKNTTLKIYNADSRCLTMIPSESVDIIITSPPYANTYDYYLYHKFRKRWLDLDVKYAQENEIGSRREYSSLKHPASQWSDDLYKCFEEMYRVLKSGQYAFIVIGDSVIAKKLLKIDEIIAAFIPSVGFEVKNIISTSLSNHSRMFNPNFTANDKQEHLIILKKQ